MDITSDNRKDSPSSPIIDSTPQSLPQWHASALPFMVVVRDASLSTATIPNPTLSSSSSSSSATTGGSNPGTTTNSNSIDVKSSTSHLPTTLTTHTRTIYPEIRYVFSDDDFVPTIDVLDSQQEDASVIIDFDATGTKVIGGAKSLSPAWQVTNVTTASASTSANVQVGGTKGQTPSWAEQAKETDSVAHILYLDGLPATRNKMLPINNNNNSSSISNSNTSSISTSSTSSNLDKANTQTLIRRFQETNSQIRKIISSTTTNN